MATRITLYAPEQIEPFLTVDVLTDRNDIVKTFVDLNNDHSCAVVLRSMSNIFDVFIPRDYFNKYIVKISDAPNTNI